MSRYPTVRDLRKDHPLTPENAAVVFIDDQPVRVESINSMHRARPI